MSIIDKIVGGNSVTSERILTEVTNEFEGKPDNEKTKRAIKQEYDRCLQDPAYFAMKYLKVLNADGTTSSLKDAAIREAQQDINKTVYGTPSMYDALQSWAVYSEKMWNAMHALPESRNHKTFYEWSNMSDNIHPNYDSLRTGFSKLFEEGMEHTEDTEYEDVTHLRLDEPKPKQLK